MFKIVNSLKPLALLFLLIGVSVEAHHSEVDTQELREYASVYTYKVYTQGGGHGTGFQITEGHKNYIVTNRHVCEGHQGSLDVRNVNSRNTFKVKVIREYDKHDLCLLESPSNDVLNGLSLAKHLKIGEYVAVLGFPLDLPATFTDGTYSGETEVTFYSEPSKSCRGRIVNDDFLGIGILIPMCVEVHTARAMTAPIYPGNSGSAVLNRKGEVVGVVFAGRTGVTVSGYFVPLEDLKQFIRETL